MRNLLLLAFCTSLFFTSSYTMDTPAEEKTWTWELFHIIDKWTDPLSYFTDPRAPKLCEDVTRFGLNSCDGDFREFTGDAQCLDDVKSALSRQRALLSCLESECLKDSGSKVELLRDAFDRQKGYYSQNVLALIESYLERATQSARNTAHILDKQTGKTIETPAIPAHLALVEPIEETRAVTYKTIEDLVMQSPGVLANSVNYIRKNWADPLKYLSDEKAQSISLAMRHLHPRHKFHTEQWQFNNKLEFHRRLIHQALERETKLTQALQYAIEQNKSNVIVNINPENPDLKAVMANIASCYSPIVRAIIKGYLTHEANKKEREVAEKKQKEQDQRELSEKSQQINPLINSLRRKLSSPENKQKLQSLTEAQRNIPTIAGNKISGYRGAGLAQVREAHQMLIEFSELVDKLLVAPAPTAAIPASPPIPPTPASSPVQMVVDTARGAQAAAPAPASETSIQSPAVTSVPAAVSLKEYSTHGATPTQQDSSPSASLVNAPPTPLRASSPQASPPRSPGGSLVAPPSTQEKSSDEEFNPRAPVETAAATPKTPVAPAAKQAQPKTGKKNR